MTIPKIPRERIGRAYLCSLFLAVLTLSGLFGWVIGLFAVFLMVWTFISDDDDSNHIDPPGTEYVNNREVRK